MTPRERARTMADRLGALAEDPIPLGQGTAHLAFAVGPYVVRLVGEVDGATTSTLESEAALLDRLQTRLPVAVPCPELVAPDLGAMAYRALPGRPLLGVPIPDLTRLVDDVAAVLRAMADIDVTVLDDLLAPDPYPLDLWRDEVVDEVLAHRDALTTEELGYVHAFARSAAPRGPSEEVFCHNDLGAEHLLIDMTSGHLLGVIDWSDAALTDPSRDLGRLTRDLGMDAVERIICVAGLPPHLLDRRRIEFHARLATLEDLSHGVSSGDERYVEASRRALAPLFGPLT